MRLRSAADVAAACEIRGRFSPIANKAARSAAPITSGSFERQRVCSCSTASTARNFSSESARVSARRGGSRAQQRHTDVVPARPRSGRARVAASIAAQLPALFLKLPHRRERDCDLIRRQGVEKKTLDQRVDGKADS